MDHVDSRRYDMTSLLCIIVVRERANKAAEAAYDSRVDTEHGEKTKTTL